MPTDQSLKQQVLCRVLTWHLGHSFTTSPCFCFDWGERFWEEKKRALCQWSTTMYDIQIGGGRDEEQGQSVLIWSHLLSLRKEKKSCPSLFVAVICFMTHGWMKLSYPRWNHTETETGLFFFKHVHSCIFGKSLLVFPVILSPVSRYIFYASQQMIQELNRREDFAIHWFIIAYMTNSVG